MLLVVEQFLNGLQFGLLLFLLAAGLTLVFGIMDLVNLAHGSLYMMGAYFAATFAAWSGSFLLGALLAWSVACAGACACFAQSFTCCMSSRCAVLPSSPVCTCHIHVC